ncbi:hypothetical protein HDU98_000259 [Podochytrium sp. JEL0797]|nr:hypothetical protein HDU98_000259 [Podochytrium sp. JEL0797]
MLPSIRHLCLPTAGPAALVRPIQDQDERDAALALLHFVPSADSWRRPELNDLPSPPSSSLGLPTPTEPGAGMALHSAHLSHALQQNLIPISQAQRLCHSQITNHSSATPTPNRRSQKAPATEQRYLAPPTSGNIRATREQLKVLHAIFEENPMPSGNMHNAIAERIGMGRNTVRNWFQNQRAKMRRSEPHAVAAQHAHRPMNPVFEITSQAPRGYPPQLPIKHEFAEIQDYSYNQLPPLAGQPVRHVLASHTVDAVPRHMQALFTHTQLRPQQDSPHVQLPLSFRNDQPRLPSLHSYIQTPSSQDLPSIVVPATSSRRMSISSLI